MRNRVDLVVAADKVVHELFRKPIEDFPDLEEEFLLFASNQAADELALLVQDDRDLTVERD